MWGVLELFNGLSDSFMTGHGHLQLNLGMMEKREKLLANYDAIPPRVWAEMTLQILFEPEKFMKRVWGL